MSEKSGFWNNAIVTSVIAGVGVPALLAVAHYAGVTVESVLQWLRTVGKFWAADVTLARWLFWVWLIVTAATLLLLALRLYFFLTEKPEPVQQPKRKTGPPHQAYVTDLFFKFRWRWKTAVSGEVWDISMFCPECDQQLLRSDFEAYRYDAHRCKCSHCGYLADVDGDSPLDMHDKVKLAAERKIRTGEWEKPEKPVKYAKSPAR